MAKRQKTTRFSIQSYDLAHYRTTEAYAQAVQALYDKATTAVSRAAARGKIDPDKPFSFDMYPSVQKEMQRITEQLASNMQTVIETGSRKQWLFACQKNDGFLASIMDTSKLSKGQLKKMQDQNLDALAAFQGRKVDGMDLSQRIWKYVGQYREQLESALDVGLGEGRSADELSRDVRQNLLDPNRLFRRVRDKRGNLVLSKAARAFHPGRGVYRSSYKNAMRLTRSEINMAYRESDWQRWQSLDFVVGFEIHRSNHEPLCECEICEKLVGRYPKTFKFKGWHPQCMCYATPILMDEETFDENELGDLKAALKGTTYKPLQAKNAVSDVPDGFKDWVKAHVEAQKGWSSTPYFIKDNFVNGQLGKGLKIALPTTEKQFDVLAPYTTQIAQARQMASKWGLNLQLSMLDKCVTEKDIASIQSRIATIQSKALQMEQADADIRQKCKEWGLSTYILDEAMRTPDSKNILAQMAELGTRAFNAEREYKTFISDANNAIIEARKYKGIDISGLLADIATITSDKREWIMGKASYKKALQEILDKIKVIAPSKNDADITPPADIEEDLNVGNVTIKQPQKVSVTYVADDKKLPFEERAKNIVDGLSALFGTDENTPAGYKAWWDAIKVSYGYLKGTNQPLSLDRTVVTPFGKSAKDGLLDQLNAINHWAELSTARNLSAIPMKWRTLFNGYVQKIESMNIGQVGYTTVYREIEAAYNIYKLSTSPMAVKYGLGKISSKMPYQLFEELQKKLKIDITKTMPLKGFFDSLEEFVPLSTVGAKGDTCYFSPTFNHVRIPINLTKTATRLTESEVYRTKILYHEFGHARDYLATGTWRKSSAWKDLFKKFQDAVNKDGGKALEAALRAKATSLGGMAKMTSNDVEQLGAYADTLQSLVSGHRYVWNFGHSVSYWKGDKLLAEFIAHASENYWGGNNLFKELYPELYREMCKLVKSMCK